jgi:hypothetical protein
MNTKIPTLSVKEKTMMRILKKFPLLAAGALLSLSLTHAQEKMTGNPPPSSQLQYRLIADIKGLSVEGNGQIDWQVDAKQYRLSFDTSTQLTGQLMLEKSEGAIDRSGLVPANFLLKRIRKEPVTVVFDRRAGQINFAGDAPAHKIQGGEQDRLSVIWQLLSMARAPGQFHSRLSLEIFCRWASWRRILDISGKRQAATANPYR